MSVSDVVNVKERMNEWMNGGKEGIIINQMIDVTLSILETIREKRDLRKEKKM